MPEGGSIYPKFTTHSPWVAQFFAIIDLEKEKAASLWLADRKGIDKNTNSKLIKFYERDQHMMAIDDFIQTINSGDGVIKLNVFKQNQRQIIQHGTFLFSTNIE